MNAPTSAQATADARRTLHRFESDTRKALLRFRKMHSNLFAAAADRLVPTALDALADTLEKSAVQVRSTSANLIKARAAFTDVRAAAAALENVR